MDLGEGRNIEEERMATMEGDTVVLTDAMGAEGQDTRMMNSRRKTSTSFEEGREERKEG